MKKIFLFLAIVCPAIATGQTIAHTISGNNNVLWIPAPLTDTHRITPFIYNNGAYTDGITNYKILDSGFNIVREFSIPLEQYSISYVQGNESTGFISSQTAIYCENDDKSDMVYSQLTKSYFSNTGDYEYIVPIIGNRTSNLANGATTSTPVTGLKMMTDKGVTVFTITFPEQYIANPVSVIPYIYSFSGKLHLLVNGYDESANADITMIYDLGNHNSSLPEGSYSPRLIKVFPTRVNGAAPLNIDFGNLQGQKNVNVISPAGRVSYSTSTSGEKVQIPTSNLPKGLNIVNISGNATSETHKIIVE